MRLRVAKKVLKNDAVRRRMVNACPSSPAHAWLMNEIFNRYRQSTRERAVDRFCKWSDKQAKWAAEHWDQIKPEPVPEHVYRRLAEMIARYSASEAVR